MRKNKDRMLKFRKETIRSLDRILDSIAGGCGNKTGSLYCDPWSTPRTQCVDCDTLEC